MTSYQVRFWDVKKIGDTAKGRWRVRWAVAGREHCKSFAARPLADGFLTGLKNAARDRQPFDETTGLPAKSGPAAPSQSWYDHARGYAEMKWPDLAPTSRRSAAEALTTVTLALAARPARRPGAGDPAPGAVRVGVQPRHPQPHPARAHRRRAGVDRRRLPARHRAAGPRRAAGRARGVRPHPGRRARRGHHPAAQALRVLQRGPLRRRAAAARRQPGRPPPVEGPRRRRDRRPPRRGQQAAALLAAVRAHSARGAHLEAFYGCLYYAALRSAEAVALRAADCLLPGRGWGRIDLAASEPRAGRDWTDHGTARQARGLKHRAAGETRPVPIPPALVALPRPASAGR